MSTITVILKPDADGTLHLPLPADAPSGSLKVTAAQSGVRALHKFNEIPSQLALAGDLPNVHCQGHPSLTDAYGRSINVCMRTTLNIDDELLARAGEFTGETEKTALVRMGLQALIEREAARRLAALGGSMPTLTLAARRRQQSKGAK